jgi:hypothetical protein
MELIHILVVADVNRSRAWYENVLLSSESAIPLMTTGGRGRTVPPQSTEEPVMNWLEPHLQKRNKRGVKCEDSSAQRPYRD